MEGALRYPRAARSIVWQLGGSALLIAVLAILPLTYLLRQSAEPDARAAIGAQTLVLHQISLLADASVRTPPTHDDVARLRELVRRSRVLESRIAPDASPHVRPGLDRAYARFSDAARSMAARPDASAFAAMVRAQDAVTQALAIVEEESATAERRLAQDIVVAIAFATVALFVLALSGWRSFSASRPSREPRAALPLDEDAQLARMEELYLIVASAGSKPQKQVERALAFACRSLNYDWAATVEWGDGCHARLSAVIGDDVARDANCKLEKAIAIEANRVGRPMTYRIDRLPPGLSHVTNAGRPFPWRHCAVYAIPGDFRGTVPHCALFLGSRTARPESLSDPDRQLLRLIGTLVASASRNALEQKRRDDLALTDPLTAMPNRACLSEHLEETIANAERTGRMFALHYIDLDGFKTVNDRDGHECGDEVLKQAASRMRNDLREQEMVARIGGDEFVVLQASTESFHEAAEVAKRLIERLSGPFVVQGRTYEIGGSVGIAVYPEHGRTAAELLRNADTALYASKRNGKGRATFFVPLPSGRDDGVIA